MSETNVFKAMAGKCKQPVTISVMERQFDLHVYHVCLRLSFVTICSMHVESLAHNLKFYF